MNFFTIEFPPSRVSIREERKAPEFLGVFLMGRLGGQILQVFPDQLIDTGPP